MSTILAVIPILMEIFNLILLILCPVHDSLMFDSSPPKIPHPVPRGLLYPDFRMVPHLVHHDPRLPPAIQPCPSPPPLQCLPVCPSLRLDPLYPPGSQLGPHAGPDYHRVVRVVLFPGPGDPRVDPDVLLVCLRGGDGVCRNGSARGTRGVEKRGRPRNRNDHPVGYRGRRNGCPGMAVSQRVGDGVLSTAAETRGCGGGVRRGKGERSGGGKSKRSGSISGAVESSSGVRSNVQKATPAISGSPYIPSPTSLGDLSGDFLEMPLDDVKVEIMGVGNLPRSPSSSNLLPTSPPLLPPSLPLPRLLHLPPTSPNSAPSAATTSPTRTLGCPHCRTTSTPRASNPISWTSSTANCRSSRGPGEVPGSNPSGSKRIAGGRGVRCVGDVWYSRWWGRGSAGSCSGPCGSSQCRGVGSSRWGDGGIRWGCTRWGNSSGATSTGRPATGRDHGAIGQDGNSSMADSSAPLVQING